MRENRKDKIGIGKKIDKIFFLIRACFQCYQLKGCATEESDLVKVVCLNPKYSNQELRCREL